MPLVGAWVLWLVLIVIGMDNLILNVALPTLVRQLHAASSQLQWIVNGYILAYAGLLLSGGSLGTGSGRKLTLNRLADVAVLWLCSPANAVVDGVLDGGRQHNRGTTGHQADGKHQSLGT